MNFAFLTAHFLKTHKLAALKQVCFLWKFRRETLKFSAQPLAVYIFYLRPPQVHVFKNI